jgi:NAD(P)-dependent dehydrogenase (short-subunit alcohol dehydrogenase family)
LIHNAQLLLIRSFEEISVEEFEQVWRTACLGAMLSARAVLPHMAARKSGLSPALAREFGPKGVHVAHVIIDGLIDTPQTDRRFGAASSARMGSGSVAQAYLDLARQNSSAWTQEMDLRPFAEKF